MDSDPEVGIERNPDIDVNIELDPDSVVDIEKVPDQDHWEGPGSEYATLVLTRLGPES